MKGFVPLSTRIRRIRRGPFGIPYRFYYWINVCFILFLIYLAAKLAGSFYTQASKLEIERAELERVERHIAYQAEVIERLRTDPQARREVAEEELWMVAPNEIVLEFDENNERIVRIYMGSASRQTDSSTP